MSRKLVLEIYHHTGGATVKNETAFFSKRPGEKKHQKLMLIINSIVKNVPRR